jgi:hypothetical protein
MAACGPFGIFHDACSVKGMAPGHYGIDENRRLMRYLSNASGPAQTNSATKDCVTGLWRIRASFRARIGLEGFFARAAMMQPHPDRT